MKMFSFLKEYPAIRHRKDKAIIIVLVLWIVVVLGALASTLAWDVMINSKLTLAQRERQIAYNLARSGIALGMTHLANDLLIEEEENSGQPYDAFSDVWMQTPEDKDLEKGGIKLGKGTFTYSIIDEESKININKATAQLLRAMVEFYGVDQNDSDKIANAIVDWRDSDSNVTGDDSSTGLSENEYYSELAGQKLSKNLLSSDLIYQCPNEPFFTIEELLDVNGITDELFWGADAETRSSIAEDKRNRAAHGKSQKSTKRRSLGKNDTLPMCKVITVYGDGGININTASEEALTIVLYAANNLTDLSSAKSIAQSIINYRGDTKKRKSLKPDDALKSVEDLKKISGLDEEDLVALSNTGNLGVTLAFKSSYFNIEGTGRVVKENRLYQTEKTISTIILKHLDVYNPDDARLTGTTLSASTGSGSKRRSLSRGRTDEDHLIRIPGIRVVQWNE